MKERKMNVRLLLLATAVTMMTILSMAASVDERIDSLVEQMTLEEKLGQLRQLSFEDDNVDRLLHEAAAGRFGSCIWLGVNPKLRNQIQRTAVEKSRLGIPVMFCMDVIHGEFVTFPVTPGLAGSFEPKLLERAQAAAAKEAAAHGINVTFAPMCDNAIDSRWGRVVETCGEDPYLSALCVAAQVRGFQGDDPSAPDRIAACLKHYCGYGASVGGRDYNDAEVSLWQLRNQHLPQFEAGVKAGALMVMSSFNTFDGVPASVNRFLLTDVLRNELGFKYSVVSDYRGICETIDWGYSKDNADAAAKALNAGNDIDMLGDVFINGAEDALKSGSLKMSVINEAVRRVLRTKFALGLFERPYVDEAALDRVKAETATTKKLALECAEKSIVMVKNEGVLPFGDQPLKVALIGPFGIDPREYIGIWYSNFDLSQAASLADALSRELPTGSELKVAEGCSTGCREWTVENDGTATHHAAELAANDPALIASALPLVDEADIIVMAIGEGWGWTGENSSRCTIGLTGSQQKLFDAVAARANGKKIVSVVFSGRPLAIPEVWAKSAAVFYAWQPGCEGGTAVARLLTGKVSPSARMTMSVPESVGVLPVNYNHPICGRPTNGGYREYPRAGATANRKWGTVNAKYPFGFGLTYTKFEYSKPMLQRSSNGHWLVKATVKNVGGREGVETAQLYVRQVACSEGVRPIRELRGFQRLDLKPGAMVEVVFELNDEVLGYIDRQGRHRCDKGAYKLWISSDSSSGTEVDLDY